jgi:hypothetical protein
MLLSHSGAVDTVPEMSDMLRIAWSGGAACLGCRIRQVG